MVRSYPFVPKSTAALVPGQFWSIPLSNGTFACGRVIQLLAPGRPGARSVFLAGLMDWNSLCEPTAEALAGYDCWDQGCAHWKTIIHSGAAILGHRELSLDGIEPWLMRTAMLPSAYSSVNRGLVAERPQTDDDDGLPVLSGWGLDSIRGFAEYLFATP